MSTSTNQLNLTKTMKTKLVTTIAIVAFLSVAGFAQTPPVPPVPPVPPGPPERHEKMPKVPVTYLGVESSEVPNVVSEQLGLAKGFGLVVDYVVPDGPAAAAGVQQNDIIKMLNDQILTDPDQLSKLVRSFSEGTTVTLTLLRKGKEEKANVKLVKKEVSQRPEFGPGRHGHSDFHFGGIDMGNLGMGELNDQMQNLKEQLGDEKRGMIHDAVMTAQAEAQRVRDEAQRARDRAQRVRDEAQRARDEARRAAGQIRVTRTGESGVKTTNIDIGKAQIVFSDEKGELRIEKIDGKKVLTAKDPQGLLLFSGPVETKEDLDKVPAEVRQRYEKLQEHDLPALSLPDRDGDDESADDADDDDDDSGNNAVQSMEQVSAMPSFLRSQESLAVLI
jgi:serine protease Do